MNEENNQHCTPYENRETHFKPPVATAKVFISFLGTGNYSECEYAFGENSIKTKYIQQALIEMLCKDFSMNDRIYFFLTEEARIKKWETHNEKGLKEIIESLKLSAQIITVSIPVGKTEDEIWEIFNIMYGVLAENDSVILDITHGFRSLPMLGFSILHYAHYLKNVTLNGIYYGAFEARDIVTNKAPIFELTQFYNLMQWASAADAFANYGISDKLQHIVRETAHLFIGTKGIADSVAKVTESMSTLRGVDIVSGSIFTSCINRIDKLETTGTFQTPFKPIFAKVKEKLKPFKENSSQNFFYAVKWYMDHKMIPQALTMMQEGLLTYLMEKKELDYRNRKNREDVNNYLRYMVLNQHKEKIEWKFTDEQEQKYKDWGLKSNDNLFGIVANIYNEICELRNDVNHGGFNKSATTSIRISEKAEKLFIKMKSICEELFTTKILNEKIEKSIRNAFCLLNHEITPKQIDELNSRFGVKHIIHPPDCISALWGDIPTDTELFIEPFINWLNAAQRGDLVILQGEFGATFRLVDFALKKELVPLYSVTKRIAKETRDGEKVYRSYIFEHICFRQYQYS